MTDTLLTPDTANHTSRRCKAGYGMGPCGKRSCAICAVRRRKDWRWVFQQNLASLGDEEVYMMTVTAPGEEVLPWDTEKCKVKGDHVHSGKWGCEVDYESVWIWRQTLESRWSKLTDAARIRTKRAVGGTGALMLAGAWELQKRGVPHVHVVVPANIRGKYFVDSLKQFAPTYGFGFVDSKLEGRHPLVAAAYLAKYLTKFDQDEDKASELLPSREFFVSREVSIKTGATVRICRFVRKWWAFQQGYIAYKSVAFKWTPAEHEFVKKFYKGPEVRTLEEAIIAGEVVL